ncbi:MULTISPECIES: YjcZ family sporulation protein [Bacillaceae]|uniref:YjcZ family sporulation protein n=1 Tax=Evansella alkalicola TaxID=745819 RepID=A0ABS6JTE8_9BACI|nr:MULTISPECIES: YjcZ family sporulation protein [Bacillaceae]MBU9721834.1 YjcZ family sporulation protein [Bacillus alkalicola]
MYGYGYPGAYGCYPAAPAGGFIGGFALVLVLFILLAILGAAFVGY